MKRKILSWAVCLVLALLLAAPVFAAQTAAMTVTASDTALQPGDSVTVTVSVSRLEDCKVGGFKFTYDEQVFTYVSGKSLAGLKGFFAGVSDVGGKVAGFFMNGTGAVEGELFSVTLTVRQDASSGTYSITGTPSLTVGEEKLQCSVAAASVTVGQKQQTAATTPTLPDVSMPAAPDVSIPPVPTVPTAGTDVSIPSDPTAGTEAPTGDPLPDTDQNQSTGEPVSGTAPPVENETYEDPGEPAFPWWIIVAVAVVAVGGTAFLIVEIKKTR